MKKKRKQSLLAAFDSMVEQVEALHEHVEALLGEMAEKDELIAELRRMRHLCAVSDPEESR